MKDLFITMGSDVFVQNFVGSTPQCYCFPIVGADDEYGMGTRAYRPIQVQRLGGDLFSYDG